MSSIYLFANIKIPIKIKNDGTHHIYSDRILVDFDAANRKDIPSKKCRPPNEIIQEKIKEIIEHIHTENQKQSQSQKIIWKEEPLPLKIDQEEDLSSISTIQHHSKSDNESESELESESENESDLENESNDNKSENKVQEESNIKSESRPKEELRITNR